MTDLARLPRTWDAPGDPMPEDPPTFEEFFDRERDRLLRVLSVITGSRAEAEDIAQEAFTRIFERWDRVGSMEDPAGYLHRAAMNVFRNDFRRAKVAARRAVGAGPDRDVFQDVDDRDEATRFLPDGTTILYVGPDGLYTTTLASHTTQKIDVGTGPDPSNLIGPAYSPSGQQIAFVERTCGPAGRLWISQVGSGTAQKVQIGPPCAGFLETAPAWSPDGVEIAVAVSGSIDLVKADGTNVQTLTQGSGFPAWYPSR